MSIDDKFGKNRNKFRRVYNYGLSRRPDVRQFVDSLTDTTKSLDFQRIIRDRDYFLIRQNEELSFPPPTPAPSGSAEYLEVTVGQFQSQLTFPVTFPTPFSGTPFLAFELSQSQFTGTDGEEVPNVAWWVSDLTTNGFNANFSAPFTGKLVYRGVYSALGYPATVNRATDLSGSPGIVSAGSVTLSNQSSVTMSWDPLPNFPKRLNYAPVVASTDGTADVGQTISAVESTHAVNELSAPFTGQIHFVALVTFDGSPDFAPDPDTGIPG